MAEKKAHYFLSVEGVPASRTEVTVEKFIAAERAAGFYPKEGFGVATGGFSGHGVRGEVEYRED